MRRCKILGTLLGSITLLWSCPAPATIVEIDGDPSLLPPKPWIFDYELQTLTRTGDVYLHSSDYIGAYYEPWGNTLFCHNATIGILYGSADSDSIFRLNAIFRNETGIPWTAWVIQWEAPFIFETIPLEDVVYVGGSKLTDATYDIGAPAEPGMVLTGDPVLPGEVFTLYLDVHVGEGVFLDGLAMVPIPEPTTALVLAFGGIGLVRTTRNRDANRLTRSSTKKHRIRE